jgi:gamma-glutamyltranspeptidase/glutathione hydrolase
MNIQASLTDYSRLGGGGFMLVRSPDGKYESIDFREAAPRAAFRDMYKYDMAGSIHGGLARLVRRDFTVLMYSQWCAWRASWIGISPQALR